MVNQSSQSAYADPVDADPVDADHATAFDSFATSLFRLTRTLRSTSEWWAQLGLRRSDVAILRTLLEQGDCRPGRIAEVLGVGPSVISRQLVALDDEQLVVRRRDPDDGRAELVSLTPAGLERLTAMRAAYVDRMREHFTDWDEPKVEQAADLLEEISDHLAVALGREPRCTQTQHDKEPA